MKKRIAVSVLSGGIILSALCGCGAAAPFRTQSPDFSRPYTAEAEITFGEWSALADVTKTGKGSYDFEFRKPDELSGVVMSLRDGEFSASLGSIEISADGGGYTTIPQLITEGLDALTDVPAENISENEGVLTIRSQLKGKAYTVTADKATGNLISLKSPYHKLAVYFRGFGDYSPPETEDDVTIIEVE